MKFTILGKNINVTEGLRSAVEDKIGKLEKYFSPDTEVHVTLSVEKERQKIEVTIPVKGNIIRSEQVSNDMYVSIDLVEEIIDGQGHGRMHRPLRAALPQEVAEILAEEHGRPPVREHEARPLDIRREIMPRNLFQKRYHFHFERLIVISSISLSFRA